jgi:hypothetical protein
MKGKYAILLSLMVLSLLFKPQLSIQTLYPKNG